MKEQGLLKTMAPLLLLLLCRPLSAQTNQTTFDFHNSFWVNLHHTLYNHAALVKAGRPQEFESLTPAETAVWNEAVKYYGQSLVNHQLTEDSMIRINVGLANAGNAGSLGPAELLSKELARVLESAAPVYRAHLWSAHERSNREWIASVTPLVANHEGALKSALARAYDTPWPKEAIRVEVSYYTTGNSAYSSVRPMLITVSSLSPRNKGAAAAEVLFHEAGHGLMEKTMNEIAREAKGRKKELHYSDFWHALQFYTNSEIVRKQLPDLEPYAAKYGLWENTWPLALPVLEKDWKPFLEGQGSFRDALKKVTDDSLKP